MRIAYPIKNVNEFGTKKSAFNQLNSIIVLQCSWQKAEPLTQLLIGHNAQCEHERRIQEDFLGFLIFKSRNPGSYHCALEFELALTQSLWVLCNEQTAHMCSCLNFLIIKFKKSKLHDFYLNLFFKLILSRYYSILWKLF